jgi:GT2 family glycosyltransferase
MRTLIGIVTRNRAAILPKALDSALGQSAPHLSVAVIDDGSSDSTASLEGRYRGINWEIRPLAGGLMSARNEFMAREGFDFFVSLDDDARFLNGDEIEVALKYFNDDPAVAAVAFDIVSPDKPDTRDRTPAERVGMFIGCGHMIRLSSIRAVGNYIATPGGYGGEEKDLCLRLLDAGYWVIRLPGVHVWHDKTPLARDLSYQHRSGVCNDLTMAVRRAPLMLLPAVIPTKIIKHLLFAWRAGLLAPCLSGLGLFVSSLPSVWSCRKPVRLDTLRTYSVLSKG